MLGNRLGSYEITAKLGEGGMGEVWRATDSKLRREVAIKVLPAAFEEDPQRLARFEREAQLLAQLQHPNIASIYGVEESGGTRALVMELVDGPTLAERLRTGALPIEECLSIASQIVAALEAAHGRGIVHRDLKPQNVKAPPDASVKVLDFGLAKAMEPDARHTGSASHLTHSPTLTLDATAHGIVLGTAAYMAPEQAKGFGVDERADIWAFGVVLWEMITGARLFEGDSVAATLAKVLESPIDLARLPPTTPEAIRRLLRRCLQRDPRLRLHDIADARLELDDAAAGEDAPNLPAAPRGGRTAVWSAGIVLGVALGAMLAWYGRPQHPRPPRKLALARPAELSSIRIEPQISPDGRALAYLADDKLWVQELTGLTPREVAKSDGASALAWSPDSRSLVFAARLQLWRTLPNGDTAAVAQLTEAIQGESAGITWTADDEIVFASGNGGLSTVPVGGGVPRPFLDPDNSMESDFHEPLALPDGRGIAYIVHRTRQGIDTVEVFAAGRRRVVYRDEGALLAGLAWSTSGYFLVGSLASNPGVWAVQVDPNDFEPRGESFLVSADASAPSISRNGSLVLANVAGIGAHQLALVRGHSNEITPFGEPMSHIDHASYSPDGTRVAVCEMTGESQSIWVIDVPQGSRSRLWSNVRCGSTDGGISWSPDSERLAIAELASGTIRMRRADRADSETTLVDGLQPELSRDGRYLVFARLSVDTGKDLWLLPLEPRATPRQLLATKATEEHPRVSPDGRYLAFVSDETGRREVHLRRFPEGSGQWQISLAGGDFPRWSPSGESLVFVAAEEVMMEVKIGSGPIPTSSEPRAIFSVSTRRLGPEHGYDIAHDDETLLMVDLGASTGEGGDLVLIEPWPEAPEGR